MAWWRVTLLSHPCGGTWGTCPDRRGCNTGLGARKEVPTIMWTKPKVTSYKESALLSKLAAKAASHGDGHSHTEGEQ